jgi:dTDP-4-dehydrorhamnose 3,5-epimerase
MTIEPTEIPDVKVLIPKRIQDARGFFAETFSQRALEAAGIHATFVQDNQSLSRERGVVRGLHYQLPPAAQGKLIRVLRGAILDIAVDIRRSSPTFGRHVAVELTSENFRQLYIPPGFAHGFSTLTADAEVAYKVTAYYSPAHDRGILWNDPDLRVDWRVDPSAAVLSEKDLRHPRLHHSKELFE